MKKLFFVLAILFFSNGISASVAVTDPPLKASEIFFQVDKTGKQISLLDLSRVKIKDFEELTGKKMKFIERLTFKFTQRQLRKSINFDGTFKNKKAEKYFTNPVDGQKGFHWGGFALGFFLGGWLIGVIIPYFFHDANRKNRIKWAWIGFAVVNVLVLIIWAAGGFTIL